MPTDTFLRTMGELNAIYGSDEESLRTRPEVMRETLSKFDSLTPSERTSLLIKVGKEESEAERELLALELENKRNMLKFKFWILKATITFIGLNLTYFVYAAVNGMVDPSSINGELAKMLTELLKMVFASAGSK